MNYRHSYHAGSFADVLKHVTLLATGKKLLNKLTAFSYLDTHAGLAYYDLTQEVAQKTGEFHHGVEKILAEKNSSKIEIIHDYVQCVEQLNKELANNTTKVYFYPGSSAIVRYLIREQDRLLVNELHPEDNQTLRQQYKKDKQVAVFSLDAYQALKALLPLKEKRGLILIDPPFEQKEEFIQIISGLQEGLRKFATGIYLIWYPIKNLYEVNKFKNQLAQLPVKNILCTELSIYSPEITQRLFGSGMVIINPPWQLDNDLKECVPWLWRILSPEKQGSWLVEWLKKEGVNQNKL